MTKHERAKPCPGCNRQRRVCCAQPCYYLEGVLAKGPAAFGSYYRAGISSEERDSVRMGPRSMAAQRLQANMARAGVDVFLSTRLCRGVELVPVNRLAAQIGIRFKLTRGWETAVESVLQRIANQDGIAWPGSKGSEAWCERWEGLRSRPHLYSNEDKREDALRRRP